MHARSPAPNRLLRSWSALLAPSCLLCHAPSGAVPGLCRPCLRALPRNEPACRRCAQPLAGGTLCGACAVAPSTVVERACASLRYEHDTARLMLRFKFGPDIRLAATLAYAALAAGVPDDLAGAAVLPVPAATSRWRSRGFNPAAELARVVCAELGLTRLGEDAVARVRDGVAQSLQRSAEGRRHNVRGAFEVRRRLPPRVVVFDDVMTSGATALELAATLRGAGVEHIRVWACTRTPGTASAA